MHGQITASTSSWLASSSVADHPLAEVAMRVAAALDGDQLTASERAQLSRELRALLVDLKAAAPAPAVGRLAELRAARRAEAQR